VSTSVTPALIDETYTDNSSIRQTSTSETCVPCSDVSTAFEVSSIECTDDGEDF
jgi:hypothetical protein